MKKLFSFILIICMVITGIPHTSAKGEVFHLPLFGDNYDEATQFIYSYIGQGALPVAQNDTYDTYKYMSKNKDDDGYDTMYFYNIKPGYQKDKRKEQKVNHLLNSRGNISAVIYINIDNCTIEKMREKTTYLSLEAKRFNRFIQICTVFHDVKDLTKEFKDENRAKMLDAISQCAGDIEHDYLLANPGTPQFRNRMFFPICKVPSQGVPSIEDEFKRICKLCAFQEKKKGQATSFFGKAYEHPIITGLILVGSLAVCGCIALAAVNKS